MTEVTRPLTCDVGIVQLLRFQGAATKVVAQAQVCPTGGRDQRKYSWIYSFVSSLLGIVFCKVTTPVTRSRIV